MSGKGKCYLCRRYWFECSCRAQGLAAQVDTRRMVETGTGSMRSTSSVVAVGDAPSLHIGTENPMTDKEILVERVAKALFAEARLLASEDYAGTLPADEDITDDERAFMTRLARAAIASMPHSERQDFSRITLRENIKQTLERYRDYPGEVLERIMAVIPVGAYPAMPHSEQVEGWQPIETAPKDGTDFLAWGEWYGMRPTYHTHWQYNLTNESRFGFRGSFCLELAEDATHWMPLPKAPVLTRNVSDKE